MKKYFYLWAMLLLLGATACNKHMEYDTSKGVDPTVTIFEKEVIVPVGSAGPFGVGMVLKEVQTFISSLGLPEDVLTADENGNLLLSNSQSFCEDNMFELALEEGDNEEPLKWTPSETVVTPVFAALRSFIKIKLHNQQFKLSARVPIRASTTMDAKIALKGLDDYYSVVETKEVALEGKKLLSSGRENVLAEFNTDEKWVDYMPMIVFDDTYVTLPEHFGQKISGDGVFVMTLLHKANLSFDESFHMELSQDFDIPVRLPLADLGINDASVNLTLENTLPLTVTINNIKVLNKKEDGSTEAIENLEVSADIKLAGGSPDAPSASNISLRIKSLDRKPIPDIGALSFDIVLDAVPGMSGVLLSEKQGISIKSSSIKIRNGVTLFGNKR